MVARIPAVGGAAHQDKRTVLSMLRFSLAGDWGTRSFTAWGYDSRDTEHKPIYHCSRAEPMLGTRGRLLRVAVLLVHAVVRVAGVHRLRGAARLRARPDACQALITLAHLPSVPDGESRMQENIHVRSW